MKLAAPLACVSTVALALIACAQTRNTAPTFTTTGAFFALSVSNMDDSVAWYRDKLGMRVVMEVPKQNKTSVTVLQGGGLTVELLENDDAVRPNPTFLSTYGIVKAGVVVADFNGLVQTLRAKEAHIFMGPFPARNGQLANVLVKDNEGNMIQFFGK